MLRGIDGVVQAQNGVAVWIGIFGISTADGAASATLVHDDPRFGRNIFLRHRLLEDAHKGVAATTGAEGHNDVDRLTGKFSGGQGCGNLTAKDEQQNAHRVEHGLGWPEKELQSNLKWCALLDLNQRPHRCERCALPLS